ncbi:MAG: phenylacetate--CoA ligase [Spirochaetia bacterium]|jgi:phenylacetate-CoA ligase|nr:phenylacetate--CoA ligase [Spirochaetia bacterium]
MFWNEKSETLDRADLEKLQLQKLRETLKLAAGTSFYGQLFAENKIDISKVTSLDHLKDFPFTKKTDLRTSYPDGMIAVDKKEIVRMHASSGTTGKSTVIFYTQHDIDEWSDQVARSLTATGITPNDVFQNMMGYGLFTGGLGMHLGAERLGCMVIPASTGNTLKQIQLMEDFHTTAMHITPSYALHLADSIREQGVDPAELNVRKAFLGAEPYSVGVKHKVEEQWNLDAYNSYGMSEMNGPGVAFECEYKDGMHLWEDFYIIEIIDPETLENLPDGEEGELVLTHINRRAMPLIRYRTRDLTRVIPGVCPCGRTHRRIDRIKGRSDDMLIVGGVNVFPSQIETVLMKIPEVGNNYQILLNRVNNLDRLNLKVELKTNDLFGNENELRCLQSKISAEVIALITVTPRLELLSPGTLPASTGKAVRVIDNREI